MASIKVQNANAAGFPVGQNVKAYPTKGFQPVVTPSSGPPAGASVAEAAVAADGSLTLAGLVEGTFYLAAAEVAGEWRYLHLYSAFSGEVVVIATQATGDFAITTPGKGLKVKEGANSKLGSAALVAGKVTVANTSITAESRIFVTRKGAAAKAGALTVTAKVAATSFTVESSNAEDASEFDYFIVEPA